MSIDIDRGTWMELSRLLDEALDLSPEQRWPWLDALAVDAGLKERLRRLLSHATRADTDPFLRELPKVDGADPLQAGKRDEIVGPYRLIRELGKGGMASVWLAERSDGLLARPVALKLPHHAWRSAQLSERMAREREILAALNHPNIATLYDAGIADDGQPFLALEFVEGEPIDEYCRKHGLGLRGRLALFLQVCTAVAHAHTKLIVHRDLKPTNILVTPSGEVRLLDFGIAKLLEDSAPTVSNLTEQSGRAMTPDYAAPEQILNAPLTVAADIYSLGVVLYELLTGARPYKLVRDSRGALENAILDAQPEKPSSVAASTERKALRGDLDTIVLKALKKSPPERYVTVHAMADDVVRYLRNRPVLAQPDHWRYLAVKFVSRNKIAVSAVATVLVAIIAGGATALREARTANAEKRRAEEVQQFLTAVLQNADPYNAAAPPRSVEQWLVQASTAIEKRADIRPDLRVKVLTILGTGLMNSQNTSAAEEVLTHAVTQGEQQLGRDDPLTMHARVEYCTMLRFRGRTGLLREQLDELLPVLRVHHKEFPRDLVIAFKEKTHLEVDTGNYTESMVAAREGVDTAMRVLGPDDPDTLVAYVMLAWAAQHDGDPAYALEVSEQAYRMTHAHYRHDAMHPRVIETERLLGIALGDAGQMEAGLEHIRLAVAQASNVFGSASRMAGLATVSLARLELKHGDVEQALAHSRSALENVGSHADKNSFRYADALAVRGNALLAAGHTREALEDLRAATETLISTIGPDHPLTKATAVSQALAEKEQVELIHAAR